MNTLPQVAGTLQSLFGSEAEEIGRRVGLIRRLRKSSAAILLKMLVFTVLKTPRPKTMDYASTAAQLGATVTDRAVEKRFAAVLVAFLRAVLECLLQKVVAMPPVATPLLKKFTAVYIGDSTTIPLPDDGADEFPGCGGRAGSGKAALKIQALWELCTGRSARLLIEPGRRSDNKSAILAQTPAAGSLSIGDLGYFSLKRFAAWTAAGAYWISRLHPGTAVFDADGTPWDLFERLRRHPWGGPLDGAVSLGSTHRVACRLIALRAPQEVVARRRQKAYEKAQKSGLTPTAEHLRWCDWTTFVTDCDADLLTWREVVVLYRSRWQIELLFQLWESHNLLAIHAEVKDVTRRMAEFWAKLIGVVVQHWLLLTTTWLDHRRSLMQAAAVLRNDWLALLMEALDDGARLATKLSQMQAALAVVARVHSRGKKPSWFQLLLNPELLEYTY